MGGIWRPLAGRPLGMANSRVREATIEAVVTRADGRVERLGVISYYHKNPLRRLIGRLKRGLKIF